MDHQAGRQAGKRRVTMVVAGWLVGQAVLSMLWASGLRFRRPPGWPDERLGYRITNQPR